MKPTLIYKNKKFTYHCYVLIHKFESSTEEDRYQFMIRDRYRGHMVWKTPLMPNLMDCCILGIKMTHDIEDNGHPRLRPLPEIVKQHIEKKRARYLQQLATKKKRVE